MKTVTITSMPGYSCAVRTEIGDLLVSHVQVRENGAVIGPGWVRLPRDIEPVDGMDPIETFGAAVGNNRRLILQAAAELDETGGCWTVLLVDEIEDPNAVRTPADTLFDDALLLELRGLDIAQDTLEAHILLRLPISGMDEAAQEDAIAAQNGRILPFDDFDHPQWKVCVVDHDEGSEHAYWHVTIKACGEHAIANLDKALARRTPWKRAD